MVGTNFKETGNIDPFYRPKDTSRQFISKDESEIVADTTGLYMKEVMDFADAKGVIGDDINTSSYIMEMNFTIWIGLSFLLKLPNYKKQMNRRVIQFRASINSLNESITPSIVNKGISVDPINTIHMRNRQRYKYRFYFISKNCKEFSYGKIKLSCRSLLS